jgi:hypothetical protein
MQMLKTTMPDPDKSRLVRFDWGMFTKNGIKQRKSVTQLISFAGVSDLAKAQRVCAI